jgi:Fic family protein
MHEVYLARGLLATTAIEGNTLTEKEVEAFLHGKLKLPPSREYLKQEVSNILVGFRQILLSLKPGKPVPITPDTIKEFNRAVLNKLELEDDIVPGKIRQNSVGVGRYLGAPSQDCEYLVERLCEWLNSVDIPDGEEVIYGLIKCIIGHIYLAWIHPFGDGNGRTARLMEAKFLLEAGVPSPAAHLLSNHYNLTRTEYYRQLDRASQANDVMGFMEYAIRGFVDQLREQIEHIKSQQLTVSWVNYVHEKLSEKTPATRRQKAVLLAMTDKGVLKAPEIKQLSPAIAAEYATKTPKTISRDMNHLVRLELVEVSRAGYRARVDVMQAFLPKTKKALEMQQVHPAPVAPKPQLELGFEPQVEAA